MRRFLTPKSYLLPLVALTCITAQAQNTTGATLTASMSAEATNQRLKQVFGEDAPPAVSKPIDLYKIRYQSKNEKGAPVILTGLLALPSGGAPKGLVVYAHGTIVNAQYSPSRYLGTASRSEAAGAVLAFATGGYAVALPDYLGLGDDTGPHPYPLGATNSRSVVDFILPVRSAANRVGVKVAAPLYITGYSEGGAVAMWTLRDLEKRTDPLYRVTAAAPISGPYDLTGTTRLSLLEKQKNFQYFVIQLYLLGNMVSYFNKSTGVKLTDYFMPSMALTVNHAYKPDITDDEIVQRLAITATLMRAGNSLDKVITPRFKKVLETLDTKDIIVRELLKNNCYDWAPRTKMLLIALQNDGVVSTKNTDKTLAAMRKRGVGPDKVRKYFVKDPKLNHITGVAKMCLQARRFFEGGFGVMKGSE